MPKIGVKEEVKTKKKSTAVEKKEKVKKIVDTEKGKAKKTTTKTPKAEKKETLLEKIVSKTIDIVNVEEKTSKRARAKKAEVKEEKPKTTRAKKAEAKEEKPKTTRAKKTEVKEEKSKTTRAKKTEVKEEKPKTTRAKKTEVKEEKPKTTRTKKAEVKEEKPKTTRAKKAEVKEEKPKTTRTKKAEVKEEKPKTTRTKKATTKKVTTKKATTKKTTSKKIVEKVEEKKTYLPEYYDLPYRYNDTVVKILYQTPKRIFVYWDVSDSDRQRYINAFGEDFYEKTYPVLLVHNEEMNYTFEVRINDFANSWYIDINDSKNKYIVQLGRKFKEIQKEQIDYKVVEEEQINLQNDFVYITHSNKLEIPNDKVLFERVPEKITFKNVKTGEIVHKEIKQVLRKILKVYDNPKVEDLYKELYGEEILSEEMNIISNPSSGNSSSFFK